MYLGQYEQVNVYTQLQNDYALSNITSGDKIKR